MSSLLADAPLTQLIPTLWKGRPASMEEVQVGVHIPHTVIYEHNFPKGLFHTTSEGFLQRRVGKEIDSKTVVDVFAVPSGARGKKKKRGAPGSPTGASSSPSMLDDDDEDCSKNARTQGGALDIVAFYVESKVDSSEFSIQFFTDAGLRAFLLGSTVQAKNAAGGGSSMMGGMGGGGGGGDTNANANDVGNDLATADIKLVQNKNGILQKFVYPIGVHNELIQVVWTSHMCIVEKLRCNSYLGDVTTTPFHRAATFQAPPTYTTRAYVAPAIATKIRKQCELLVDQIYLVEHRLVEQLTLYFKVDEREKLWLLWCPSIRFTSGPMLPKQVNTKFTPSGGLKPAILPDYQLPLSCMGSSKMAPLARRPGSRGGQYAGSRAKSGSSMSNAIASITSSGGDGATGSIKGSSGSTFRIASSTSFVAVDEDGALGITQPKMHLRCTSTRPASGEIALPTQSKLCKKMKWLQQPLKAERSTLMLSNVSSLSQQRKQRLQQTGSSHQLDSTTHSMEGSINRGSISPSPTTSHHHRTASGGGADNTTSGQRSPMTSNLANQHNANKATRPTPLDTDARNTKSASAAPVQKQYTMADLPRTQDGQRKPTTIELAKGKHRSHGGTNNASCNSQLMSCGARAPTPRAEDDEEETIDMYSHFLDSTVSTVRGGSPDSTLNKDGAENALHHDSSTATGHHLSSASLHGNYATEMALVLKLTRAPVNSHIPKHRVPIMVECKQSIEYAMEVLDCLRDTCYSHFLLHDEDPLPFSIPKFNFTTPQVYEEITKFLSTACGFESISLEEAVELDKYIDRRGVVDEISHHHRVLDDVLDSDASTTTAASPSDGEEPHHHEEKKTRDDVACFVCRECRQCNTLSARLTPFFVVNLRNVHGETEFGLMPSHHSGVSTPVSKDGPRR